MVYLLSDELICISRETRLWQYTMWSVVTRRNTQKDVLRDVFFIYGFKNSANPPRNDTIHRNVFVQVPY